MSQPADDQGSFAPPEGPEPADRRPPPHESPYGEPPAAPPTGHGMPPGAPPPGYGGPGAPPAGHARPAGLTSEDTIWALFCYAGTIIAGFLVPLVIYFIKRRESAFVRHHAAQALNYQLTVLLQILIAAAIATLIFIATESPAGLIVLMPVVLFHVVAQYVFLILGAIRSGRGETYRIPTWTCWRMVR